MLHFYTYTDFFNWLHCIQMKHQFCYLQFFRKSIYKSIFFCSITKMLLPKIVLLIIDTTLKHITNCFDSVCRLYCYQIEEPFRIGLFRICLVCPVYCFFNQMLAEFTFSIRRKNRFIFLMFKIRKHFVDS